ncbi:hypothetical protein HNQ96_005523 [Aminobacter lissarensis]|uniref:Uncharacterized protein n=1 Tax=Aminobacter carboxidus TaxID=376165 RepID=A0A8E1WKG2_9HYPH|nr:hypothetical protein [Aminobacter lissarensis]
MTNFMIVTANRRRSITSSPIAGIPTADVLTADVGDLWHAYYTRHSRPRERAKRAESVGNPCRDGATPQGGRYPDTHAAPASLNGRPDSGLASQPLGAEVCLFSSRLRP